MVTILDEIYGRLVQGVPKVSRPIEELAKHYLDKNKTKELAVKEMVRCQTMKCGLSGFCAGIGGAITLPVFLPTNITNVLYVQLRMVAAIAYMGGFDIRSDQVQTLAYACLTGSAVADSLKSTGIKVGQKFATSAINKIPGKVLTSINQKVGFRLLTKFGTKGAINLVKLVPVAGGLVGGALDIGSTQIIARNAYHLFIDREIPSGDSDGEIVSEQ